MAQVGFVTLHQMNWISMEESHVELAPTTRPFTKFLVKVEPKPIFLRKKKTIPSTHVMPHINHPWFTAALVWWHCLEQSIILFWQFFNFFSAPVRPNNERNLVLVLTQWSETWNVKLSGRVYSPNGCCCCCCCCCSKRLSRVILLCLYEQGWCASPSHKSGLAAFSEGPLLLVSTSHFKCTWHTIGAVPFEFKKIYRLGWGSPWLYPTRQVQSNWTRPEPPLRTVCTSGKSNRPVLALHYITLHCAMFTANLN